MKNRRFILISIVVIAGAISTLPASAQNAGTAAPSVQNVFERHGRIGTFAENCTTDPADNNQYISHRALDAGRVQRDLMKSRTTRAYAGIVDSAGELPPSDVIMTMSIIESAIPQMKDWRMRIVTRVDGNRIRLIESGPLTGPFAGRIDIAGGRAANGGEETRWLSKCP
jgi:hypothetical protein